MRSSSAGSCSEMDRRLMTGALACGFPTTKDYHFGSMRIIVEIIHFWHFKQHRAIVAPDQLSETGV